MTVPVSSNKSGPFVGNNNTTQFPFSFTIDSITDIKPYITDSNGNDVLLSSSKYRVIRNNYNDPTSGGYVEYPYPAGTKLQSTEKLTILREVDFTQTDDLKEQGRFSNNIYEKMVDKTVMMIQQLAEKVGRAVTAGVTYAGSVFTFPSPVAGKVIGWDASGSNLINLDNTTLGIEAQMIAATEAAEDATEAVNNLITTAFESDETTVKEATHAGSADLAKGDTRFQISGTVGGADTTLNNNTFYNMFMCSRLLDPGKSLILKRVSYNFSLNIHLQMNGQNTWTSTGSGDGEETPDFIIHTNSTGSPVLKTFNVGAWNVSGASVSLYGEVGFWADLAIEDAI